MVSTSRAVALHGKNETAAHHVAVEPHRAGAAHAVLAADMRAGEREIVAQEIDQRLTHLDTRGNVLAVHTNINIEVAHAHAEPRRPLILIELIASSACSVISRCVTPDQQGRLAPAAPYGFATTAPKAAGGSLPENEDLRPCRTA